MKYFLLATFIFISVQNSIAQSTIEITYESKRVPPGISIIDIPSGKFNVELYWHSIMTSDTSYTFATFQKKLSKQFFSNGTYGRKAIHHSAYYIDSSRSFFEVVNFKGNYLTIYQREPDGLVWMDTTRNILGYKCQAAFVINPYGDTAAIMWISRFSEENRLFNHHGYLVPGLVMESLNLKHGLYYKAILVKKTNNKIVFPTSLPVLSVEESRKRRTQG